MTVQPIPTLTTGRLILKPFTPADVPEVHRLAGAREIADTTLAIPHPYSLEMAENWISTHGEQFTSGQMATFAVTLRERDRLIGAISLKIEAVHERAGMGYWIGREFWGNGYCSEAAGRILAYGFTERCLNRIEAGHFSRNPASGRVMQKIGMTREGCLRSHIKKWDRFEDVVCYAMLREEFQGGTEQTVYEKNGSR